ncbi:hypothetical protein F7725_026387 [Dissostichus mawsoni]|uniref:Ig-like domain-containing protein n=1 Tax=Dissostichus mawsoni TaxID=36200 RepID=A0A7J5X6X0_DISMA|nr:hypothetical protein F7725_026387 [Dissostichus mawsoni]
MESCLWVLLLGIHTKSVGDSYSQFMISSVDLPGAPEALKITDVWGFNVALEWKPRRTTEWFTVYEQYRRTNCVASDLIMGNEYVFRAFAINQVGLSLEPCNTTDSAYIQKTAMEYKPPSYKDHDFSQAPKFTHPLVNRSIIAGYSTTLSCSVRGSPKPKVTWFKNKMDISNEAKYRMLSRQGVLTLEIRKPCTFDGGCICAEQSTTAEDIVECKLEVRCKYSAGDTETHVPFFHVPLK